MKKLIIFLILSSVTTVFADDLIVDKNAMSQYQRDNYVKFDRFDFHGGHWGYKKLFPSDRIYLPQAFPVLGTTFTLEAWVYSKSTPTMKGKTQSIKTIIGDESNFSGNYKNNPPMITFNDELSIKYGFGTGSASIRRMVKNVRSDDTWQHVAYTFDGTISKLYVDGVLVDSTYIAKDLIPIQQPISRIGKNLQGKIDEVRVWKVVRTQAEIQSLMDDTLSGNENGLIAYYPMDTNSEWQLVDRTSNQNHATIKDAEILQRYFSNACPSPDGSYDCPYPTIRSAFENVKAGDRIFIKEGRYSEVLFEEYLNENESYETEGAKITVEGENENVILDGTVSANANWESYNLNGHSIYKAVLNMQDISSQTGAKVDSIYGVWVNDRYMIPAMPINFKNPTDPTTGNQDNPEPGSIWSLHYTAPYEYPYYHPEKAMPLYTPGDLANLDTLEEWSFDPQTNTLYLYPGNNMPNPTNVRLRVRTNILHFEGPDNFVFKNIHFFAGAIYIKSSSFITIEDSKFSHSWEANLRHYELMPLWTRRGNIISGGTNNTIRNCIFQYINDGWPIKMEGVFNPHLENILFQYNDWFNNTTWSPSTGANCRECNDITNDNDIGPSVWRYITVNHVRNGGLNPGRRGLMEYVRIENQYMNTDGGGIQRTAGNTIKSTTRYSWLLNTNRSGMRFDSWCAGHDGMVHNVVSAGQKRGFRLKGDRHKIYHIMGYDNYSHDISLTKIKYCGEAGSAERDSLTSNFSGRDQFNNKGNINTEVHNVAAGWSFECNSPDCGESGMRLTDVEQLLGKSGIWYGRSFPIDKRTNSHSFVQLELEDPFIDNRGRSDEQLVYLFGKNPWKNNQIQNYDFRPKKGSVLIDGGVVIPGINDGQDMDFNHPPLYPGQNRKYIGAAPDIGPYEYGDSVYWIPGYRYPHPSVPIPRDGGKIFSLDYGLAWNYPYKRDYSNVTAVVNVVGPGVNRTETFQYPNNVLFETFEPGGTYNWSVSVDGVDGGNWTFTVANKVHPLNDRSVNIIVKDSLLNPIQEKHLQVSKNHRAYLRFDIPSSVNGSYKIDLNLIPEKINKLNDGVILYRYHYKGWNESRNAKNIGLIDNSLLTPIDTLYSLVEGQIVSTEINTIVDTSREYSFALGVINAADSLSFYSKEKLVTDGAFPPLNLHYSGYAPETSVWPSLSFSKDSLSVSYDIPMEKGWNLISVPFKGVKTRPKQIFSTLIRKGLLEYVSSPSGYFKPKDPYSTLTSISSKEGYYIKLNGPVNKIFFRGRALTDKTISLSAGWNMIAYSPDYELAVDKAFESLIASNTLQYVTGFVQGALVYDPDAPQSSTLNTLKPTKGYWVKVKEAVTSFSFPAQTQGGSVGKIAANHSVKHPEVKPNPSFMFVKGKIMGRYNVGDWVKVLSEDNHVVGAAIITEGGYLRNSAVYGDDVTTEDIDGLKAGEKIAFAYDGDTLTSHVQFNPMSFHEVKLDYDTFLPTTFALHQNHPNPFNPITTIRYDLPENGPVSIIIYDLMGREIKTLVKQVSAPGRYSVNWNGRNKWGKQIASGMYFYRMETPGFQSVKKLIFLK